MVRVSPMGVPQWSRTRSGLTPSSARRWPAGLFWRNGLSHPRQQEYSHFRNPEKSAGGQAR